MSFQRGIFLRRYKTSSMSNKTGKKIIGVALDVGTTDVKGVLVDLSARRQRAVAGAANEQRAFGQDVITRLHLAADRDGLLRLQKKVIITVNRLIAELAEKASVKRSDIRQIVAVGNTVMYHLLLMISVEKLAQAPFVPSETASQHRKARELGIDVAEGADFTFLPSISGFVGSDMLATLLSVDIHKKKSYVLLIDMGTNGELALGCRKGIFVASCASGPAFEARHISCGMPAQKGSVIRASFRKGRFIFKTIGNMPPSGISGSGLIDIVSHLLAQNRIERNGRIRNNQEVILYERGDRKISLNQKDIRQIQLAKAAFAAGIEILRRKAQIDLKEIKHLYITGTFGGGVDKRHARNIGLIPKDIPLKDISFLKDGALCGAKKVLLDSEYAKEIERIRAKCCHVALHEEKDFQEIFTAAISF